MVAEEKNSKDAAERRFRGLVHVDRELCKGCGFCVEFCPNEVLELSSEFNSRGYHPPVMVNREACTGRGLCSAICPDFAITTQRVKIEDEQGDS